MATAEGKVGQGVESKDVLDAYFLENRAKILDLAAFIDRFERGGQVAKTSGDHRWKAVIGALGILTDDSGQRARRILELWSDPTVEPAPKADVKGATGAWPGLSHATRSPSP